MQKIQYQIFLKSILANYDDDNVSRTAIMAMLVCLPVVAELLR